MFQNYELEVYETVIVKRLYIISARSLTEAKNKAVIGDTVDEQTIGNEEVVNRELA